MLTIARDDNTWKLFAVPSDEVIMTGTDTWLGYPSQVSPHATAPADNMVRLWSLTSSLADWDAQ